MKTLYFNDYLCSLFCTRELQHYASIKDEKIDIGEPVLTYIDKRLQYLDVNLHTLDTLILSDKEISIIFENGRLYVSKDKKHRLVETINPSKKVEVNYTRR